MPCARTPGLRRLRPARCPRAQSSADAHVGNDFRLERIVEHAVRDLLLAHDDVVGAVPLKMLRPPHRNGRARRPELGFDAFRMHARCRRPRSRSGSRRSALRRGDVRRLEHLGQHGVAGDRARSLPLASSSMRFSSSSMTTNGRPSLLQAARRRCCRRGRSRRGSRGRSARSARLRRAVGRRGGALGGSPGAKRSASRNSSGLSRIERIAPVTIRSRPSCGSKPELDAERREDEGELADLREARGDQRRRSPPGGRTP